MKEDNKVIYRIINGKGENRRLDRRYIILGLFIFMVVASFSFIWTRNAHNASAADLSKFRAGNIMSDAVMRNYTSMTEGEIQNFLQSKNSCNLTVGTWKSWRWDTSNLVTSYRETTSPTTWHVTSTANSGTFVCIANERINGETAAHIIWQAAQDYKINPQVLIVLLQKEQGLITDTYPNSFQYRSATGYGCPDTAACDTKYYGFKNQVRNAAALFNTVLSGGWTNYPVGNNYIRYNPDGSCGGSTVYVENLATSALYRYTPYQPNQGALNVGYGSGVHCGAYGNRNFYAYFTDWFGSTQVVQYSFAQRYHNDRPVTTGNLKGGTVCKTSSGSTADLTKAGTYSCYQEFSKGTLYWTTVVDNNLVRTEKDAFFLPPVTSEVYRAIPKDTIKSLGSVVDTVRTVKDVDGVTYQAVKFTNGYAMRNGSTVKTVTDKLRITWLDNSDMLGSAEGDVKTLKSDSSLKVLDCEYGVVIGNDKKGYHAVKQLIYEKWDNNQKILGLPTSDWQNNSYTGMEWQNFENGVIVGNDKKGWHLSIGESRSVWANYGFEGGVLGFPTSDFHKNSATGMEWQDYTGGKIVGNDTKGWFISYGGSRSVWERNGFEGGVLGFPTSNIQKNSSTGMQWQYYEHGVAVGNDQRGWFISYGGARSVWSRTGFEGGALGWPTSDVQRNNSTGMQWQNFTGGVAVGNDSRGWYESRGNIRNKWAHSGFESGRYGWPTSDIRGNCQNYTGGTICN